MGPLSSRARLAIALCLFAVPTSASAGPPGDDWTIETHRDDSLLVDQRFSALKKRPFDKKQWRALEKALGKKGLQRRIERAHRASPKDLRLGILMARVELERGQARAAATRLHELEPKAGRLAGPVFELRLSALESARDYATVVGALEARAENAKSPTKLLERAYTVADRGNLDERALSLAERLARLEPNAVQSHVRVATSARRLGRTGKADAAYALAIEKARGDRKLDLATDRARNRLEGGDHQGATALLWELLEKTPGKKWHRERWWAQLEAAHRRSATSDQLATRLREWLSGDRAQEAAAWKTLARAEAAAGIDPVPSWRRARKLDTRDVETGVALVTALESAGDAKAALEAYRQLDGKSPHEVQLGLEMAGRLLVNGERETALQVAAQIAERGRRNSQTLLLLLDFYNGNDEHELALSTARRLVEVRGRDLEARVALGEQLYQMGRREEALRTWAQLPKIARPAHVGWARHAEILAEHAVTDRVLRRDALASIEKALKAKPKQPAYLRSRAMLYEERGRPDRALGDWEAVLAHAKGEEHRLLRDEARTRIVELLASRGGRGHNARERARVIASARAALESGSGEQAREAGLLLAELFTREDDHRQSVAMWNLLVERFPGEGELLMGLANSQRRAGLDEAARATLERVLEVDPTRKIDVLSALSELAYFEGDLERAERAAIDAAAAGADGIDALMRLGELHERRGRIDEARAAYRAILERHPGEARARLRIAELQLTEGDVEGAAKTFRALLEAGGPEDLMRSAGQRALDLAEVTESTAELLDLAVKRTQREPSSMEPRGFLLDALDRVPSEAVEGWLRNGSKKRQPDRVRALRHVLTAALGRGSAHARLRAADHLGELALPDTAVALARTGANLQAPRQATDAVRNAFANARVASLRAVGHLDEADAVPTLHRIVRRGLGPPSVRHAAMWALARSSSPDAKAALRDRLKGGADDFERALACVGLAASVDEKTRMADLHLVSQQPKRSHSAAVRHACALARATLTPDGQLDKVHDQLRDADPTVAAIAAWRLGELDEPDHNTVRILFETWMGAPGLQRDAAAASLARLLQPERKRPADEALPELSERFWKEGLERWLLARIAPTEAPIPASAVAPHRKALRAAVLASREGTRAQSEAAAAALRCEGARGKNTDRVCLPTLVDGPVRIAPLPRP